MAMDDERASDDPRKTPVHVEPLPLPSGQMLALWPEAWQNSVSERSLNLPRFQFGLVDLLVASFMLGLGMLIVGRMGLRTALEAILVSPSGEVTYRSISSAPAYPLVLAAELPFTVLGLWVWPKFFGSSSRRMVALSCSIVAGWGLAFVLLVEPSDASIRRNEDLVYVSLCEYYRAQRSYRSVDRDGDGVLEYAVHLRGPGSLYGDDDNPLRLIPRELAEAEWIAGQPAKPYHGYLFKVLTKHKSWPSWQLTDFFTRTLDGKEHMTEGFALVAFPAEYGKTGISSYTIISNGTILGNGLGERTFGIATKMDVYDVKGQGGWALYD